MPCSVFIVTGSDRENGNLALPGVIEDTCKGLQDVGCRVTVGNIDDRTSPAGVLRNIRRLKREVASAESQLVHAQYGTVTAAVARVIAGSRPLIITFRGDDLLGTPNPGLAWRIRERLARWIGLWGARRAAGIIVMSENLRVALPRGMQDRATLLPFGVDMKAFQPLDRDDCRARLGWDRESQIILFNASIGTNRNVKNLPLARESVKLLSVSVPKTRLQVISDASRAEVCQMMNAADCLLVTSLHEGSPSIVREAMACNLPVVSVPCGDVAERLRSTQPGSIQPYDAAALAKGLREVLQAGCRSNGRDQVIAQRLTLQDVSRRLLDIYMQVLPETGPVAEGT